jgi:hypothetical protein
MGLCLVGRHPIHSEGGYSHGLGQNATSAFLCPRSSGLAPRLLDGYLLMNSLVIEVLASEEISKSGEELSLSLALLPTIV